jgi:hypothetical protein
MRVAGETIGVRGIALLAASGVFGIVLAVHGWSVRNDRLPTTFAGAHASRSASARARSPAAPVRTKPASGHAPASPPATSPPATSPSAAPKLSSQPYARYAFQVWPGPMSQAATAAATGLSIVVHKQGSGIVVAAGVIGQPKAAPKFYPAGAKVYVIEAALGDDSGHTDFNLGDDALVVTDSLGRIVQ